MDFGIPSFFSQATNDGLIGTESLPFKKETSPPSLPPYLWKGSLLYFFFFWTSMGANKTPHEGPFKRSTGTQTRVPSKVDTRERDSASC